MKCECIFHLSLRLQGKKTVKDKRRLKRRLLWGCRKTNVFRAASRSKPRFRAKPKKNRALTGTFFLPLDKKSGTRPDFLWICFANSILCVLPHETQNAKLTSLTDWRDPRGSLFDILRGSKKLAKKFCKTYWQISCIRAIIYKLIAINHPNSVYQHFIFLNSSVGRACGC